MEDLSRCMREAGCWLRRCCWGEDGEDAEGREKRGEDEDEEQEEEVILSKNRSWTSLPSAEVSVWMR